MTLGLLVWHQLDTPRGGHCNSLLIWKALLLNTLKSTGLGRRVAWAWLAQIGLGVTKWLEPAQSGLGLKKLVCGLGPNGLWSSGCLRTSVASGAAKRCDYISEFNRYKAFESETDARTSSWSAECEAPHFEQVGWRRICFWDARVFADLAEPDNFHKLFFAYNL
jgi:hypothetical protein